MIFDKDAKIIQWEKDSFFQQMSLGKADINKEKK